MGSKNPFYTRLLRKLDDGALYTDAAIARFAVDRGLFHARDPRLLARAVTRLKKALFKKRQNHAGLFPAGGDGLLKLPGQACVPAYKGWRYRATVEPDRVLEDPCAN